MPNEEDMKKPTSLASQLYKSGYRDGREAGIEVGRQMAQCASDEGRDEGYRAGWFEGRQDLRRMRWIMTVLAFCAGLALPWLIANI
tara:strand:- start:123 stop:380 length:258 start_codon:yes stop_codon:yes gene_type:complete